MAQTWRRCPSRYAPRHNAAQLLASFGQAFLPPQEDDSHRSLAWDEASRSFASGETNDVVVARLSVPGFALEVWRNGDRFAALDLAGRRPSQALSWLGNQVAGNGDVGLMAWPEYDLPAQPGGKDAPLEPEADFVKALALGADGVAVANPALQAIGCLGMRACHTNNCPVGIAT